MIKSTLIGKYKNISHGFFNKLGGYSTGIYKSLNCGPGSKDNLLFNELVSSAWPPVEAIDFPAVKILGPGTVPLTIAFLNETVIESESPRFLTVVNPAIRVFLALLTDLIA